MNRYLKKLAEKYTLSSLVPEISKQMFVFLDICLSRLQESSLSHLLRHRFGNNIGYIIDRIVEEPRFTNILFEIGSYVRHASTDAYYVCRPRKKGLKD